MIDTNVHQFDSFYEWTVPELSSGESYRLKLVSNATNAISFSRGYITIQSNLPRIGEFFNFDSICINFFIISPNPASEYIEITGLHKGLQPLVQDDEIRIYNVLGECVKEIPPTPLLQRGTIRIDVSGLAAGICFVRFGEWVGSFVKVE